MLNFNGRVEKASVKNFQLIDKQERKSKHKCSGRGIDAVWTREQARVLDGRAVASFAVPGLFDLFELLRLQVRM